LISDGLRLLAEKVKVFLIFIETRKWRAHWWSAICPKPQPVARPTGLIWNGAVENNRTRDSGGCQRVGQASRLSPFTINLPPLNDRQTRWLQKTPQGAVFLKFETGATPVLRHRSD
jgi:hypothetical protein